VKGQFARQGGVRGGCRGWELGERESDVTCREVGCHDGEALEQLWTRVASAEGKKMFFPRISTKRAFCGKDLMGDWTSWASSLIHPAPCRARNQYNRHLRVCVCVCVFMARAMDGWAEGRSGWWGWYHGHAE
jgi:hypothetical protein